MFPVKKEQINEIQPFHIPNNPEAHEVCIKLLRHIVEMVERHKFDRQLALTMRVHLGKMLSFLELLKAPSTNLKE